LQKGFVPGNLLCQFLSEVSADGVSTSMSLETLWLLLVNPA